MDSNTTEPQLKKLYRLLIHCTDKTCSYLFHFLLKLLTNVCFVKQLNTNAHTLTLSAGSCTATHTSTAFVYRWYYIIVDILLYQSVPFVATKQILKKERENENHSLSLCLFYTACSQSCTPRCTCAALPAKEVAERTAFMSWKSCHHSEFLGEKSKSNPSEMHIVPGSL